MPTCAEAFLDVEARDPDDPGQNNLFRADEIEEYLTNCRHIYRFKRNGNNQPYTDKLCFFRCLAGSMTNRTIVTRAQVETLYQRWVEYCRVRGKTVPQNMGNFQGVAIDEDIPDLEDCFQRNIHIYTLTFPKTDPTDRDEGDINEQLAQREIDRDNGIESDEEVEDQHVGDIAGQLLVRSMKVHQNQLYLNLNSEHFSLITDIQKYARFWRCQVCDRVQRRRNKYIEHLKTCEGSIKYKYSGGGYGTRPTIFQKLRDEGIDIDAEDQFYKYAVVYDFECRFETLNPAEPNQSLVYEKRLVPVSVSIKSNVPGFSETVCFIHEDPRTLIAHFYSHLNAISDAAYELQSQKFTWVTDRLEGVRSVVADNRTQLQALRAARGPARQIEDLERSIAQNRPYEFLTMQWLRWLRQMPVVGFNSGKFDLNLIRKYFIPHVMRAGHEILNPITRGNQYLTFGTEKLMFLDISNFIAAGTTYKKWLSAFNVEEQKGVFPYEWLTDFAKLSETELPPIEAFFSTLKQKGITQQEYDDLQQVWVREGFRTMKDLLVWYNNLDVGPFIVALEKMRDIFRTMDIDMLKSGNISLPGLAMVRMFQDIPPDTVFQVYNESNKDIRQKVQENVVGGPSIVFKRLSVNGQGSVKGGPPPEDNEGYDAAALYTHCIGKPMPTGIGIRWDPKDGIGQEVPASAGSENADLSRQKVRENSLKKFRAKSTDLGLDELIAINVEFRKIQAQFPNERLTLRHKFNGGQKMFRFGRRKIPVDGWIPEKRIIIQYHGCYFHGHSCNLTRNRFNQQQLEPRAQTTREIGELLRQAGCQLVEIRECEFNELKAVDPEVAQYAKSFKPPHPGRKEISMKQIVNEVKSGQFFGMVEVDLQVPYWNAALRTKMSEFPPIFKNTEVSIDNIGDTMAEFARENGYMKKPRRTLISSYHGTKMLIATPLLRWYLDNGLVITRVYSAIQYVPNAAFAHLPAEVAEHRRRADANPDLKAYGELFKLTGNSYYGKCLTDVAKHELVEYLRRFDAARRIQAPQYRKTEIVDDGVYEVHLAKSTVEYKLPINIAFFVYSYAKLRMLEFYYDFLLRVLPPTAFELTEMDTDSLYFAITGPTLEATVPETHKDVYNAIKSQFLAETQYEQRTPGLFKLEWSGKGMVALCPKTYVAYSFNADGIPQVKVSSKGLSKTTNNLSVEDYMRVLEEKAAVRGINRGFVMKNQELQQYYQWRNGLTYLYIKRKVAPDGIHTFPLDI